MQFHAVSLNANIGSSGTTEKVNEPTTQFPPPLSYMVDMCPSPMMKSPLFPITQLRPCRDYWTAMTRLSQHARWPNALMVLNLFILAKTEIIKDTFCSKLHEDILAVDHGECERGNLTRTGSEFENELMRIRHNFLRIRDRKHKFHFMSVSK